MKNGGTSTVLTIVADPKNEKGQVLKVTPANTSANQYPQAYFENGQISKRGRVTFVYDIIADASVTGKNFSIHKRATSDNGTPNLSGTGFSINDTTRKNGTKYHTLMNLWLSAMTLLILCTR